MNVKAMLAVPPSERDCWEFRGLGSSLVRSWEYERWIAGCRPILEGKGMVPGPVRVVLTLHRGKGVRKSVNLYELAVPVVQLLRGRVISGTSIDVVGELVVRCVDAESKKDVGFVMVEVGSL